MKSAIYFEYNKQKLTFVNIYKSMFSYEFTYTLFGELIRIDRAE